MKYAKRTFSLFIRLFTEDEVLSGQNVKGNVVSQDIFESDDEFGFSCAQRFVDHGKLENLKFKTDTAMHHN